MSPKPSAGPGAGGDTQPGAGADTQPGAGAEGVGGGRANRLIEKGGRELLDLSASFGAASLGYSHPAITDAVSAACANMAGASLLCYPNENAAALAEDLLRLTPGRGERRVWFGHSGSDANDCAMRVGAAGHGRSWFI